MVKVPLPPPAEDLVFAPEHDRVIGGDVVFWRLHRTVGAHVVAWNQLRHWGPLPTMRFDPHEPPLRQQERGVSYAATDVPTALAEVFQQTRVIALTAGRPYLCAWSATRPLTLLDLTGRWPIRSGASYSLNTARRDVCRMWAQRIHQARPDLDGLWHHSAMTGRPVVTLFTHAADSFPPRPSFGAPLDHPDLRAAVSGAAEGLGYSVV